MKRATQILLAVMIMVLTAGPAMAVTGAHEISVKIPEIAVLVISEVDADFGEQRGPGSFELTDAAKITYRCNSRKGWQLTVSATDFVDGDNSFPASKLSVKVSNTLLSDYTLMDRPLEVDNSTNYASAKEKVVLASYTLDLTGEEFEGNYISTVTYTLVILDN